MASLRDLLRQFINDGKCRHGESITDVFARALVRRTLDPATGIWEETVVVDPVTGASRGINAQTGTAYTFVLADAAKTVTGSNAGTITYTIPSNAVVVFEIGTIIPIIQLGAGTIDIAPAGGVTLHYPADMIKTTRAQYSEVFIKKIATNTWLLSGDLSTG